MISFPMRNLALAANMLADPGFRTQLSLQDLAELIGSLIEQAYMEIADLDCMIRDNTAVATGDFGIIVAGVSMVGSYICFTIYTGPEESESPEQPTGVKLVGYYYTSLDPEPNVI